MPSKSSASSIITEISLHGRTVSVPEVVGAWVYSPPLGPAVGDGVDTVLLPLGDETGTVCSVGVRVMVGVEAGAGVGWSVSNFVPVVGKNY